MSSPLTETKAPKKLEEFLSHAIFEITGEKVPVDSSIRDSSLLSCISYKIAKETGLDSCDIASWISQSVKNYWSDTYISRDTIN